MCDLMGVSSIPPYLPRITKSLTNKVLDTLTLVRHFQLQSISEIQFGSNSQAVNTLLDVTPSEWLRRLTRNQFPSGSVGSNPTGCEIFLARQTMWPNG